MLNKQILIAPDSFKESMTAQQASEAIIRGFRSIVPDTWKFDSLPMADGGEGTMQSLADALGGRIYETFVTGPLGDAVTATYAISGDQSTAIIEMAEASGLHLVPENQRNPLVTTTYGTGELIKAALNHGVSKIILGIGGSATNDGGAGMIQALGGRFYDEQAQPLKHGASPLLELADIDVTHIDARLQSTHISVACDVDNPLLGPTGASAVYGPQKGADDISVATLDQALNHYHNVLASVTGHNVKAVPGAGAAGGLGASLLAFLNAALEPGIQIVLEETRFYERVKHADLVITGEGKIDRQTIYGKTPVGVAQAAKHYHVPVIALCGTLGTDYEDVLKHGIDAIFSIVNEPGQPLQQTLRNGETSLEATSKNIASVLKWPYD
ncbi:glycerate kinase [Barrientosiimonas marina]|uniref:Glycerate kinase n=1 Tax=Lentibacillus kimchii TaxID=1542911 RepID=A0ABW2USY3_9BACI